jgi:hypothetical protein
MHEVVSFWLRTGVLSVILVTYFCASGIFNPNKRNGVNLIGKVWGDMMCIPRTPEREMVRFLPAIGVLGVTATEVMLRWSVDVPVSYHKNTIYVE